MTSKRARCIIARYHSDIQPLLESFYKEKTGRYSEVRINGAVIEDYRNRACHCHPEYTWEEIATLEEFYTWLDEKNKEHGGILT